jgi:hypothetical protein
MTIIVKVFQSRFLMTLEQLSMQYFGTQDYETALVTLAPSSIPVRKFLIAVHEHNLNLRKGTNG